MTAVHFGLKPDALGHRAGQVGELPLSTQARSAEDGTNVNFTTFEQATSKNPVGRQAQAIAC